MTVTAKIERALTGAKGRHVPGPGDSDYLDLPTRRMLGAELKIAGVLGLDVNLEHGDELVITVAGADGEVLARSEATVTAPPSFVPIEDDKVGLIGYVRAHKAKLGERLA